MSIKENIAQFLYRKYNSSFSQGGEDLMLAALLTQFAKGFFVDVGAFHPVKYSNTYHFYKKGWSGINIDAAPGSMELFNKLRPRDINLEVAISETPGTLTYYYKGPGDSMNTFSRAHLEQFDAAARSSVKEIPIEMRRLDAILGEYAAGHTIHFMSIDVEGFEMEVLRSNDWKKFRPYVLALESYERRNEENDFDLEIRDFLAGKGYKLVIKTLTGIMFVRDDLRYNQFNHIIYTW